MPRKQKADDAGRSWYTIVSAGKKRATIDIDGEIGGWGITARQFKRDVAELGDVANIKVRLNSIGGGVGEGVSIKNTLKDHPAKVHVAIDGYALSIGSVIAMAGDKVTAADDALFMIHDPWTYAAGNSADLIKEAAVLDKHKDAIVAAYLSRDAVVLDEEELREAMSEETWYTAVEAREAGFVDSVEESDDAKNTASIAYASAGFLRKFKNAPESFQKRAATAVRFENQDGSAVATQPKEKGKSPMSKKTYTEAELNAAVAAAKADASTAADEPQASYINALLNDDNATIERVRVAAELELSEEQASAFMAYVALEVANAETVAPGKTVENKTTTTTKAPSMLERVMQAAGADLDNVNRASNSTRVDDDDPEKTDNKKPAAALDPAAELAAIKEMQ